MGYVASQESYNLVDEWSGEQLLLITLWYNMLMPNPFDFS